MSPTLKFPEKVSVELLACLQVAFQPGPVGVQGEGEAGLRCPGGPDYMPVKVPLAVHLKSG